ncbi:MAG: non-ribosomal peptide synthetase [Bacillota bacterium]
MDECMSNGNKVEIKNHSYDTLSCLGTRSKEYDDINENNPAFIHQIIESQAEQNPNRKALVYKEKSMTYRELNTRANQLAWALRERGVKRDSIVGIFVDRSFDMIISIIGVLKAGGAYLPLDMKIPSERIKYILNDCQVSLVLVNGNHTQISDCNCKIMDLAEMQLNDYEDAYPTSINSHSDLAYVIYTSGTTGEPKGVMIEHQSLRNFLAGITQNIDFSAGKSVLCLTTVSFDIFVLETLVPLAKGLSVVIVDEEAQRNPKLLCSLILDNHVDIIQMTPSRIQWLTKYDDSLQCFKNIKDVLVGGEEFPKPLLKKLQMATSAKIYNLYGPTEATVWVTVSDLTNKDETDIGKPILNTRVYILDDRKRMAPFDTIGELYIAGRCLARGYINKQHLTEEKFVEDPFVPDEKMYKTGDLAKLLPDGRIKFLGRNDNQVKIRGYRIEIEEIESVILSYDKVIHAAVIVKEGKEGYKYLVAFISMKEKLSIAELKVHMALYLPDYMIPEHIITLEKLPETISGKINRSLLNEYKITDTTEASINDDNTADENNTMKRLFNVLKQCVEIPISMEMMHISDNLSDFGINSITFIKFVVGIEAEFGISFEDDTLDINRLPDLPSLISYIEKLIGAKSNNAN